MIFAAAFLLLAQMPPPPSGRPLAFGDVEIVDPIAPMVSRYTRCVRRELDLRGGMNMSDRPRYRRAVDEAVRACAAARAAEIAQAEAALALAPDYRDPARRAVAIRHAFEGSDRQLRDMPEISDAMRQRDVASADPSGKPEAPALRAAVPTERLVIPDDLGPAIAPYMGCLFASRGTNVRLAPGSSDPRPPGVAVGTDCTAQRTEAARRADDILRAQHRLNPDRRRALIEETLANVDRFVMPGGPVPSRPAGAMGSIDIPYQAIPAFQAYSACVRDRFHDDPRRSNANPDVARRANQEAVAACRAVRAEQLARALAAQTDSRMYGSDAAAKAAVRRAFDRFDSDYVIEPVPAPGGGRP